MTDLVITAVGAMTPVGINAAQTFSSIRAGLARIQEHPYLDCQPMDPDWDEELPLLAGITPTLDPLLDGPDRLTALSISALKDLMANGRLRRRDLRETGMFVSLPQQDEVIAAWSLEKTFVEQLCRRTGLPVFPVVKTSQKGHVGVLALLEQASVALRSGELACCIVCGVDSYLLEDRLELWDRAWRIRSDRNVDGFIPGEASVMVLVETADHAHARGVDVMASLGPIGIGQETNNHSSGRASTGAGLAEAIRGVLPSDEDNACDWAYCDLNGESYRAFEWGVILSRLPKIFSGMRRLVHPADCIGDVGAATGALLLGCTATAFQRGYHCSNRALIWTASDDGTRIAASVTTKG